MNSLNGLACYPRGSFFSDHMGGQKFGKMPRVKVADLGWPLSPQPNPWEVGGKSLRIKLNGVSLSFIGIQVFSPDD